MNELPCSKWLLAIHVSFSMGYNFYLWLWGSAPPNSFIENLSFTTKTRIWIWFLQVSARSWKMWEIDETKQWKRWGLKKDFFFFKKKRTFLDVRCCNCWIPSCHSYKCNIKQENPTGGISLHISRCWKGELQACVWLFIESTFSFTAPKDTLWIHNMTMRFREFFEQRTKSNLLFTLRASKKIDFLLHPACFAKTILHCRRIWED